MSKGRECERRGAGSWELGRLALKACCYVLAEAEARISVLSGWEQQQIRG